MQLLKRIILGLFSLPAFLGLNAQTTNSSTVDTAADCFYKFFDQAEKVSSPAKLLLVTKAGKTTSLAALLKTYKTVATDPDPMDGLVDLDSDGKKELVIYDFTGGAHCCDEFSFYKNIGPNKYQFAAKTFGGDICISANNEFAYSFDEHFGYFFTCYACMYTDTTDAAPISLHSIVLKYSKGKLIVKPGDKDLRSQINDNLGKLGEQPYQPLHDAADQDNGLRKEFAFNLSVFYYSFGHNLVETKKLFDKYYKYTDAKKVWTEFASLLKSMNPNNDF